MLEISGLEREIEDITSQNYRIDYTRMIDKTKHICVDFGYDTELEKILTFSAIAGDNFSEALSEILVKINKHFKETKCLTKT